jgi:hypothetical protein
METAAFMGISLSEFYKMTPREFFIYEKGYLERKKLEQKEYVHQAYLISRWVWQKKIDIKKILEFKQEKKIMTDSEMLEQAKILNVIFGGEVKTCKT